MMRLVRYVAFAAVLVVLGKLLERRGHRSHGLLLGMVPYDFRIPTFARLKAAFWSPNDPHLLTAKAFGIGWSPNLGAIARKVGIA
jgi:hypothetical protein